jgi:hypothetical protein
MCIMVYVASDDPHLAALWDKTDRAFRVAALTDPAEPVRRQFTRPHVYYVGSHEHCGCGFQCDEPDGTSDRASANWASRRRLAEFLADALQRQPPVELFTCWDGDQAAEPEHRGRIRPADLVRDRTVFHEKEYLVVCDDENRDRS